MPGTEKEEIKEGVENKVKKKLKRAREKGVP